MGGDGRHSKVVRRSCAVRFVGDKEVTKKAVRLRDRKSVRQKPASVILLSLFQVTLVNNLLYVGILLFPRSSVVTSRANARSST